MVGILSGMTSRYSIALLLLLAFDTPAYSEPASASWDDSISGILGEIGTLESNRDPKCYATASRLEDFMYGTPLASEARFRKFDLQKALAREVWGDASRAAIENERSQVSKTDIEGAAKRVLPSERRSNGDRSVTLPDGKALVVAADDLRQYGSVAYSLRAILAVGQDTWLESGGGLLELDDSGIAALRELLDLYTLVVLKRADARARLADRQEIDVEQLARVWRECRSPIAQVVDEIRSPKALSQPDPTPSPREIPGRYGLLERIVAQKIASYEAYNELSSKVFLRNIQVYFARRRWPADTELAKRFRSHFTEAMVTYAKDLLVGAEREALPHQVVRVRDVDQFTKRFIPHEFNDYEDVTFFPNLPPEQRVTIESYDMDAFRDGGLHWRTLGWAVEDLGASNVTRTLGPDPFAAELIAETVAHFGVLLLRGAGEVARDDGRERLHPDDIEKALRRIQQQINAHLVAPPRPAVEAPIVSSTSSLGSSGEDFFTDVTRSAGIDFTHRSADWLSRFIRSYTKKSANVATLAIPPAFGGSGVAAEDVDGDGRPDILALSGSGNALLLNKGGGRFADVTRSAGLDWRRPDGLPGEPRQPLVADFDNDGRQDILITYVNDDHRLYRNIGRGRFEDVTAGSGLGGAGRVAGPAVAFDYDRDGLLDVYVGYFGDYLHGTLPTLSRRNSNGLRNKLFRNTGSMHFRDVTPGSGVDNEGWTQAATHTDLDGDGWQDLIVGNDFGVNAYYRNLGNGRFQDVSQELGTNKPSYTMNIGLTDLNGDSFPDVYISNIVTLNKDEKYVAPNSDTPMKFDAEKLAHMRVLESNDLFVSQAIDGKLVSYQLSDAVARGASSTGWAWDADFFDFDNDSDDDLYCVNGMNEYSVYGSENAYYTDPFENKRRNVYIPVATRESNVFFVNEAGKLKNVSERSGANLLGNSRSAAYLDFDGDGDLDVFVNNYHGAAVLYRNNSERLGGNWLTVRLIGDPKSGSNRDAIGARIVATTTEGNKIWREVHGSIGYLSVHPKEQHFGLGKSATANITVHWPNGQRKSYSDLEAGGRFQIDQSTGAIQRVSDRS